MLWKSKRTISGCKRSRNGPKTLNTHTHTRVRKRSVQIFVTSFAGQSFDRNGSPHAVYYNWDWRRVWLERNVYAKRNGRKEPRRLWFAFSSSSLNRCNLAFEMAAAIDENNMIFLMISIGVSWPHQNIFQNGRERDLCVSLTLLSWRVLLLGPGDGGGDSVEKISSSLIKPITKLMSCDVTNMVATDDVDFCVDGANGVNNVFNIFRKIVSFLVFAGTKKKKKMMMMKKPNWSSGLFVVVVGFSLRFTYALH